MKIGIVTFFKAINYGAMLQAYALMRYLENRGHKVQFVAHERLMTERIPFWRCFLRLNKRELRNRLSRFFQFEIAQFADIMPQTCFSRNFNELVDSCKSFDAVIVGSDQMWNPMWCADQYLPLVMLDFACPRTKRIAYAVSFGNNVWPEHCNKKLTGELLAKFCAVSVREEAGIGLVRELSGRRDAQLLVDPTLLHDAAFYRSLFECGPQVHGNEQPYIFEYVLDEWDSGISRTPLEDKIKKVANTSIIVNDKKDPNFPFGRLLRYNGVSSKVSVQIWLRLIANSKYVITNSFHGTVFAILFHKPFVVALLEGQMSAMNCRVTSLLHRLGLSDRIINGWADEDSMCALSTELDWEAVDNKLNAFRVKTGEFFGNLGI